MIPISSAAVTARIAAELPTYRWITKFSRGRWLVRIWEWGDCRSYDYTGDTEARALKAAFDATLAFERARQRRLACPYCKGLGWYIVTGGDKEMCRHPQVAA